MSTTAKNVSKTEFIAAYDSEVQGRKFVEDLPYYRQSRERFWQAFRRIADLGLPAGSRAMDVGGGITGVLLAKLLDFDVIVADVIETARQDVEELGLSFVRMDLFRDEEPKVTGLDLVVLQEVIEHIPQPPYIVMRRIQRMLAPQGYLFLTTPNGHRFRNLVYMALGREILDTYRYPGEGEGLGHQHEYTLKQLLWQAREAGFDVIEAEHYRDGWRGASPLAKAVRLLIYPLETVPHFRNSLAMMLRNGSQ